MKKGRKRDIFRQRMGSVKETKPQRSPGKGEFSEMAL